MIHNVFACVSLLKDVQGTLAPPCGRRTFARPQPENLTISFIQRAVKPTSFPTCSVLPMMVFRRDKKRSEEEGWIG